LFTDSGAIRAKEKRRMTLGHELKKPPLKSVSFSISNGLNAKE
jgi:hypothetical protein